MKLHLLLLTIILSQIGWSQNITEIKFVGEYTIGRAPCEMLPDGTRRWAKTTGFEISDLIEGNIKVTYLEITPDLEKELIYGQKYWVVIKLTEERISELELNKSNTIMTYRNPIKNDEVIKIENQE